jgi:hypothetical protein
LLNGATKSNLESFVLFGCAPDAFNFRMGRFSYERITFDDANNHYRS